MFDFNLKPIPGTVPTFSRNAGSNVSPMNPQHAYSPTSLQNNNLRNTKANLPLGGGNGFFLSPYSPMGSKKSSTIQTDSNTNTLKLNQERKGNLQSSINDTSILPLNPSLEKLVELWEQHPDLIKDGLKEKGIKAWVEDSVFCLQAGRLNNSSQSKNAIKRSATVQIVGENGYSLPIKTSLLEDGDLMVSITNINNPSKEFLSLIFEGNEAHGWQLNLPDFFEALLIPPKTPLDQISGLFAAFWVGMQMAHSKKVASTLQQDNRKQGKSKGGTILNSNPAPCFLHDYACTFGFHVDKDVNLNLDIDKGLDIGIGIGIGFGLDIDLDKKIGVKLGPDFYLGHIDINFTLITLDGKLKLWFPCGGILEINVLDCCKKHDVRLWCSNNRLEAISADVRVVLCVMDAVLSKATEGSLWCDLVNVPWFLALYGPLTALSAVTALVTNIFHSDNLVNYDGRNNGSCLCNGDQPTYLCSNPCVNLCKEEGKNADCVRCEWRCDYENGLLMEGMARLHPIGIDVRECCNDTRGDINNPSGRPCNSPPNCPTCFNCYWDCIYNEKIEGWELQRITENENSLPCCIGTPTFRPTPIDIDLCARNNQRGKGFRKPV